MNVVDKEAVSEFLVGYQQSLCRRLEKIDADGGEEEGAEFISDEWQRNEGGGGVTRVIANGQVFEKGGVNFSRISGSKLPATASASRPEIAGRAFEAMGVSIVLHPLNPMVPTSHANIRLFVAEKPGEDTVWWFGGGFDLTPYYIFEEDCINWHRRAFEACSPFGDDVYSKFKAWCDDYFYLAHRKETRGVGGLFFDDLHEWGFEKCFSFLKAVANAYATAYEELVQRRMHQPYSESERSFQLYRRGRYVEFNLVFDRGTLFGLQSGGRTESILMSLPPKVEWHYQYELKTGSREAALSQYLKPIDWLAKA